MSLNLDKNKKCCFYEIKKNYKFIVFMFWIDGDEKVVFP